MIAFDCGNCGRKLRVKDDFAGRTGQCPACGHTMDISGDSSEAAPVQKTAQVLEDTSPDDFQAESAAPSSEHQQVEVCHDSGENISHKDDFFVLPPSQIGPIVSASTTLRTTTEPL